jgi:ribosome-binding protein aMBF1 (putative translation factor)
VERIRAASYRPSRTAAEVLDTEPRARAASSEFMKAKSLQMPRKTAATIKTKKKDKPTNAPFARRFPARDFAAAEALAANVRRLRTQHELSQGELGAAVGSDQAAISLIEGARSNPTLRMIESIAKELDTTAAELLRERRPRG